MQKRAELFYDNGHQAVRLPDDIQFTGDEVIVQRNESTGDVVLSAPTKVQSEETMAAFVSRLREIGDVEERFLAERNYDQPSNKLMP